jgi:hypothetical protein
MITADSQTIYFPRMKQISAVYAGIDHSFGFAVQQGDHLFRT